MWDVVDGERGGVRDTAAEEGESVDRERGGYWIQ